MLLALSRSFAQELVHFCSPPVGGSSGQTQDDQRRDQGGLHRSAKGCAGAEGDASTENGCRSSQATVVTPRIEGGPTRGEGCAPASVSRCRCEECRHLQLERFAVERSETDSRGTGTSASNGDHHWRCAGASGGRFLEGQYSHQCITTH